MTFQTMVRISAVTVTALVLAGCYTPPIKHEYELSPGQGYNPTVTKALIIPLNETREVETGLEPGVPATRKEIAIYLESKGLVVEQHSIDEYQAAERAAANEAANAQRSSASNSVSESLTFTELVPHLIAALDSDADIIVVPNMVIRSGTYQGRQVRWDGVKRRERGVGGMTMTGTSPGASLFTVIYDRDGTRVFSGYGGLDLLFELNVIEERYDLREDRLLDIENLREGVCVSFHPFFGLDEDC